MSFLDNHSDKTKGLQVKLQTCEYFGLVSKKYIGTVRNGNTQYIILLWF